MRVRAAKEITGETEFVVIGSQALHGAFPNLVDKLVTSHECDIYIPNAPEKTELLNSIGMMTPFAQTYGYYADPVDPDTAKLPGHTKTRYRFRAAENELLPPNRQLMAARIFSSPLAQTNFQPSIGWKMSPLRHLSYISIKELLAYLRLTRS
jgi:hypothetical protein